MRCCTVDAGTPWSAAMVQRVCTYRVDGTLHSKKTEHRWLSWRSIQWDLSLWNPKRMLQYHVAGCAHCVERPRSRSRSRRNDNNLEYARLPALIYQSNPFPVLSPLGRNLGSHFNGWTTLATVMFNQLAMEFPTFFKFPARPISIATWSEGLNSCWQLLLFQTLMFQRSSLYYRVKLSQYFRKANA